MALTNGEAEVLVSAILGIPNDTTLMGFVVVGVVQPTDYNDPESDVRIGVAHSQGMCMHNVIATLASAIIETSTGDHSTEDSQGGT